MNSDLRSEFFTIWLSVNLESQSPAKSSLGLQLSYLCGRSLCPCSIYSSSERPWANHPQHTPSITPGSLLLGLRSNKLDVIKLPIKNIWRSKPPNPHKELKPSRTRCCRETQHQWNSVDQIWMSIQIGMEGWGVNAECLQATHEICNERLGHRFLHSHIW